MSAIAAKSDAILAQLDRARTALAEAKTIQEAKKLHDVAASAEVFAKHQGMAQEAIDYAHAIKIEALRRLGEMLAETKDERAKGTDYGGRAKQIDGTRERPSNPPPTLADLGLTKKVSSIAQALAALPQGAFEQVRQGTESVAQAIREVRREEKAARPAPAIPVGTFDLIYADPPWQYDFAETESRAIENQYPTMTVEELCALRPPIAKNCVLFLWATAPKLKEALLVMEAWGFTYKTNAAWDKQKIGMGYWFRGQHELLLVGTRGSVSPPDPSARAGSLFSFKRGQHSAKPQEFYGVIEAMLPKARRVELFARTSRDGWASWGNHL